MAGAADGLDAHRHHRLILVRPGEAVARRAWPAAADSRPLTDKGGRQAKRLGRFLAGREVDVTTIVSGEEARERETADILAAWLQVRAIVDPRLVAGLTVPGLEVLLDDVARLDLRPSHRQRTLVVARDPLVSLLLVLLTDSPGVDLARGGAAGLRIHEAFGAGCASICWLVEPSMLRGIRSRRAKAAAPGGGGPAAAVAIVA